jgi:outer membrane protein OmpA-like peptidoglycan-associated protein
MKNFLIFLIFLSISLSLKSQTEINLRQELSPEVYKEWDSYIRKYAPADSAFRVVATLVQRHRFAQRNGVCRHVLKLYEDLFPNYSKEIRNAIEVHTQVMLSQTPNPDMVKIYHEFIQEEAPKDDALFAIQRLADPYIARKDWDSAAIFYKYYKPFFTKKEKYFDTIINVLTAPEEGLIVRNLGDSINTKRSEWDPNPTPDGKYLYFSASGRRGYRGSDIWVSEMKDGVWQKAENLGPAINGNRDETIDNVTVDGNGLLLSGTFPGTFGNFDIFLAEKNESDWNNLVHFPMPINSEHTDESGNITSDGKALIFTSDRPGGIGEFIPFNASQINRKYHGGSLMGNMDIYVSLKSDTGWSEPINLGPKINTPYAERSAYLHPDGKTLYFSSNGHPGLGRLDVYKSVRLSDTSWTEWSEPVNLGKEINSEKDDWGYKVGIHGDSAVFAAMDRMTGLGEYDIYSISLPKNAKPQKIVGTKGQVIDSRGFPLSAKLVWEDFDTGEKIGELRSDPRNGSYFIALPYGKKYKYYAERYGYYSESSFIDLTDIKDSTEYYHNIEMVSIRDMEKNKKKITLESVYFEYDSFELSNASKNELDRISKFLKKKSKSFYIYIEGHTDNIGSKEYNLKLSRNRAESVAKYILEYNNLDAKEIITAGKGFSEPITTNDSKENRQKNRRVEISLRKHEK